MIKKSNKRLSQQDYEFMNSLSAAVLQVTPSKLRVVLYFWLVAIIGAIIWANFAIIDEIVRGTGEIIPSGENQIIQNLEGGIVKNILVKEGQVVEKRQILVKIDNQKSKSSFNSNTIKADALEAKVIRLEAEANATKFKVSKALEQRIPIFVANEKSLYLTNQQKLSSKVNSLKEQFIQKKNELLEAKSKLMHLKRALQMIHKEVRMTKPMVLRGVSSKVDFLKLQTRLP